MAKAKAKVGRPEKPAGERGSLVSIWLSPAARVSLDLVAEIEHGRNRSQAVAALAEQREKSLRRRGKI